MDALRDAYARVLYDEARRILSKSAMPMTWDECCRTEAPRADVYRDRADTYLASLADAGFVMEPGWQPIETAPRDRDIEVWNEVTGAYRSRATILPGSEHTHWPLGFWDGVHGRWYPEPALWRPLSTPPAAARKLVS